MKPRTSLTPTMLRTRYHERRSTRASDGAPRPPRPLPGYDEDFDATADWLAHIEAGRIQVR